MTEDQFVKHTTDENSPLRMEEWTPETAKIIFDELDRTKPLYGQIMTPYNKKVLAIWCKFEKDQIEQESQDHPLIRRSTVLARITDAMGHGGTWNRRGRWREPDRIDDKQSKIIQLLLDYGADPRVVSADPIHPKLAEMFDAVEGKKKFRRGFQPLNWFIWP